MQAVTSKDTGPELYVRRLLHSLGYRYRLHRADLPGCPDLAFPTRRKAIFVHGCFWHGHGCERGARVPKSNTDYWKGKVARNRARDLRTESALLAMGWEPVVVWECELRDRAVLTARLTRFLNNASG
ncbi:MAG: DNA mismatch endonuclease Vsr [Acidobacteria bacterium]|nr:DNA mismatch endonuclease Vsr [Acidobacteriota bacterium]